MTQKQIYEKQIKDWKTKYSNLETKYKDIVEERKQLYEVIHKMNLKIDAMNLEIAELKKENKELKATVATQKEQIQNLTARINKTTQNSSKPSSTEVFKKTIQNNRQKSTKKIGGQFGHKGATLLAFAEPTNVIDNKILVCKQCKGVVESTNKYVSKQLVDIEIGLKITEERTYEGICSICGKIHHGEFSERFVNPVQYGENIKSLVTTLNSHGYVSVNKTAEIINSITNDRLKISDATIVNIQNELSKKIDYVIGDIKENLIKSQVLNADETGCRVNAKTNWIQVFSNDKFTLCNYNEKRGSASIDETGILKYFLGILVHDHFSAYYKNELIVHAECNAHILRYLKNILEILKRDWTREMIEHLVNVQNRKKEKIASGNNNFTPDELEEISSTYSKILLKGQEAHEEAKKGLKKLGCLNDEKLLLKRLSEFKKEHLLFANNFIVPFDNNQAERDIRPFKTKTKMSGGFRSKEGVKTFSKIYSVISTLKKQKMNIYKSIFDFFSGKEIKFA